MIYKAYPFNTLGYYIYADVVALYNGKFIFSKHKKRTTLETQGGHIEIGETPLEAAKRELHEECGAVDFDIEPLCDYSISGYFDERDVSGNCQMFFAVVHSLGEIPHDSEMEKVFLFDNIPDNLTYPELTNEILPIVQKRLSIL